MTFVCMINEVGGAFYDKKVRLMRVLQAVQSKGRSEATVLFFYRTTTMHRRIGSERAFRVWARCFMM